MNPLGLPHRSPFCAAPDVSVHSASVHRSPAPRLRGPCGGDAVPSGCGAPRKPGEGAETLPRGVVPAEGGRLGRPGRVRCFMGGGSASGGGQGLNQGLGGVGRLHAEACAPTPATVVQGPCRDPRRLRVPPRALGPSFFWVPRAASRRQHRASSARGQILPSPLRLPPSSSFLRFIPRCTQHFQPCPPRSSEVGGMKRLNGCRVGVRGAWGEPSPWAAPPCGFNEVAQAQVRAWQEECA